MTNSFNSSLQTQLKQKPVRMENGATATPEGFRDPAELGKQFTELYEKEWKFCFESLKEAWTEEEIIYQLLKIVRYVYDFCQGVAEEQMKTLVGKMDNSASQQSDNPSNQNSASGFAFAQDYRKTSAGMSVPVVQQLFLRLKLPAIFDQRQMNDDVEKFTRKCIELVWYMVVHTPPIAIKWQPQGDHIQTDLFQFYQKEGKTVNWTVWPAVLLQDGGDPITKGWVLPI